jgi:hypothetical protein
VSKLTTNIGIINYKGHIRLGVIKKGLYVVPTYHNRDLRLVGTCKLEPYGACFIYDQGQISRHIDTRKDSKTLSWHIYIPMDQKQNIKKLFEETA